MVAFVPEPVHASKETERAMRNLGLIVVPSRLPAFTIVDWFIAVFADTQLFNAGVFSWSAVLALLANNVTLASVNALLAIVTDSMSGFVFVYMLGLHGTPWLAELLNTLPRATVGLIPPTLLRSLVEKIIHQLSGR